MPDEKKIAVRASAELVNNFDNACCCFDNSNKKRFVVIAASLKLNCQMVREGCLDHLVARSPFEQRQKMLRCGPYALGEELGGTTQFRFQPNAVKFIDNIVAHLTNMDRSKVLRWAMHTAITVTPSVLEGWKLGVLKNNQFRELTSFTDEIRQRSGFSSDSISFMSAALGSAVLEGRMIPVKQTQANVDPGIIREVLIG